MKILFSMILGSLLWIQVPQWDDDWEKCAVDVPDAACHWYVMQHLIIHLVKDLVGKMLLGLMQMV